MRLGFPYHARLVPPASGLPMVFVACKQETYALLPAK